MLENISNDITKLVALYEGEKRRADDLHASLQGSREELEACRKQIAELNRQIDNQRLTSAFTAGGSNPDAKDRLTRLIGEIDKCIALLEG